MDAIETSPDASPTRRTLLKVLGIAGGAAVATAVGAAPALAKQRKSKVVNGIVVYRLSARGSSCRACSQHHRYLVFATHALAAANRAHAGCNCPITAQELAKRLARRLFPAGVGLVDLRKLDPKPRA
jgi:hypothetical protein